MSQHYQGTTRLCFQSHRDHPHLQPTHIYGYHYGNLLGCAVICGYNGHDGLQPVAACMGMLICHQKRFVRVRCIEETCYQPTFSRINLLSRQLTAADVAIGVVRAVLSGSADS